MFRLLTYNILEGGRGRSQANASVINSCAPDLVMVQEATDPTTLVSVGVSLMLVALLAVTIPALRAMKVDPITALRQ